MKGFNILLISLFVSCVQPVNIVIDESHNQETVLSGLLEANSEMPDILRLNSAGSPTSTETIVPLVDQINFISDGTFLSESQIDSNGYIRVPAGFPGSGANYEVIVELTDNSQVSVIGTAPMPPVLGRATFQRDGTLNSYGEQIRLLTVEIADPPGVNNYYELLLFYYNPGIPRDVNGSISYYNQTIYPNNILASEGDQEYLPKSMFFSDELFDGQTIKFEQHIESGGQAGNLDSSINAGLDDEGLYLQIRSINSEYYSFLKSWTRHRYTQDLGTGFGNFSDVTIERLQDVIFAPEPTPLITNITGGLGVVGAAYTQIIKLQR